MTVTLSMADWFLQRPSSHVGAQLLEALVNMRRGARRLDQKG